MVIKDCDCFHPNLQLGELPFENASLIQPCNTLQDRNLSKQKIIAIKLQMNDLDPQFACFDDILGGSLDVMSACLCQPACEEMDFDTASTASTWPSEQYWKDMAAQMGYPHHKINGPAEAEVEEDIQKNFIQATVYFKTLNVRTIDQKPKYTVSKQLSLHAF